MIQYSAIFKTRPSKTSIYFITSISALVPYAFPCWESSVPSAPAAPSSAQLAAPYLHAASEKPPFYCQTSKAGCTSRRKPAVPGSPLPAPCRGGLPVLFRRAALDRSLAPAPEVRHTRSGQRPVRRNIFFLFFQPFQTLLHGCNVLGKFIGSIFLRICQRHQKQIFLRT